MQGTHGKLDELNSILQNTQKKLNTKFKVFYFFFIFNYKKQILPLLKHFQVVCGGLTSLMKFRPGGSASNVNEDGQTSADGTSTEPPTETNVEIGVDATNEASSSNVTPKRSVKDIGHKVGRQIDVLDSLLAKSERAELSMHEQNKEMKRHLK